MSDNLTKSAMASAVPLASAKTSTASVNDPSSLNSPGNYANVVAPEPHKADEGKEVPGNVPEDDVEVFTEPPQPKYQWDLITGEELNHQGVPDRFSPAIMAIHDGKIAFGALSFRKQDEPLKQGLRVVISTNSHKLDPHLAVQVSAAWLSDPEKPENFTIKKFSLSFCSTNVISIKCCKVSQQNLAEVRTCYGCEGLDEEKDLPLEITVECNRHHVTTNFLVRPFDNMGHPNELSALAAAVKKGGVFSFLVDSQGYEPNVTEIAQRIAKVQEQSPLGAFFEPSQRWSFTLDQIAPSDKRPNPNWKTARLVFNSFYQYLVVTGFGIIEEMERNNLHCSDSPASLRLLAVPEHEDRVYLGFLTVQEGVRLNEGDIVKIDVGDAGDLYFDPVDEDTAIDDMDNMDNTSCVPSEPDPMDISTAWTAVITTPSPLAPLMTVSLVLYRRRQQNSQNSEKFSSHDLGDIKSLTAFRTHDECRNHLVKAYARPVTIRPTVSDKTYRRQVNALRRIYDGGPTSSAGDHTGNIKAKQILLGTSISTLPLMNFFHSVNEAQKPAMEKALKSLNDGQRAAAEACREMPGGITIVQGPPGTGKTEFIARCLQAIHASKDGLPQASLVVSASNASVDDLAMRIYATYKQALRDQGIDGPPVVIRLHSLATEHEVALKEATTARNKDRLKRIHHELSPETTSVLAEMEAANLLWTHFATATAKNNGVNDKRMRHMELSLGAWMIKYSGLKNDDYCNPDTRALHGAFRELYQRWHDDEGFDDDFKTEFTQATRALQKETLGYADIIVTTLSNAADPQLHNAIPAPASIIVDEAGRAMEADCLALLAWYKRTPTLLIGDSNQLPPFADNKNPWQAQMQLSLLSRFSRAGYPEVTLTVQHRFNSSICRMISQIFYKGALITGPNVDDRPTAAIFRNFLAAMHGRPQNWLVVNVPVSTSEHGRNRSKINRHHVTVVMEYLRRMIKHDVPLHNIVIITPYVAQRDRYNRAILYLQAEFPAVDLRKVRAVTVDGFQGQEATFCILDVVSTDQLGFFEDGRRVNTAVSRVKDGLLIITNETKMSKTPRYSRSHMAQVVTYARREACFRSVSDSWVLALPRLPDNVVPAAGVV